MENPIITEYKNLPEYECKTKLLYFYKNIITKNRLAVTDCRMEIERCSKTLNPLERFCNNKYTGNYLHETIQYRLLYISYLENENLKYIKLIDELQ